MHIFVNSPCNKTFSNYPDTSGLGSSLPAKTLVTAGGLGAEFANAVHDEAFLACDSSKLEGWGATPGGLMGQSQG